ncbi:actin-3 isoform X2 [Patella vulgata]|uniref:actin-3 isoform X2 n=1 Tax=Patella vulgata TaxID=6465 RepID=UPI0024A928E2|nr:actin-3 isoform X2 [Patella vulgata]
MSQFKLHNTMSVNNNNKAVVIDCGSADVKAGHASDKTPEVVFSNLVGYDQNHSGSGSTAFCVGDGAKGRRGQSQFICNSPVEQGIITRWDDMERVWNEIFSNQLKVDSKEHPVIMTQIPSLPQFNREKITELMFEKFQVPGFYLGIQSVLALYSAGLKNGIVYDSGDGVTYIVPVKDGYAIQGAIERLNVAGSDLTSYLQGLLLGKGDRDIAKDIKEKLCYIASDYDQELKSGKKETYQMPDGTILDLGEELFQCPEILFTPSKKDPNTDGIHTRINGVIQRCDSNLRSGLYNNIVLSGGSTMFKGFGSRLNKEMSVLAGKRIEVTEQANRKYASWIGGSILGSLPEFSSYYITRADYEETGAKIVHTKCA